MAPPTGQPFRASLTLTRSQRKYYQSGTPVTFSLWSPRTIHHDRKLTAVFSDRLIYLFLPSLYSHISTDGLTKAKTIRLTLPHTSTLDDIEIPGLEWLLKWLSQRLFQSHGAHLLPPADSVEQFVLLMRACQIVGLGEGEKNMVGGIEMTIRSYPLTPDDIKSLWYVRGNSQQNIEDICGNLARLGGIDEYGNVKDEYVRGFLRDEVEWKDVHVVLETAQVMKKNLEVEGEEMVRRVKVARKMRRKMKCRRVVERLGCFGDHE
ncbi:hypothetical protein M011DRAFT_459398 [Sporormia fimetaria CBS 119925]|uniref:BTB domain-containing protein n=1 Tax=Sporormia fimetaria CBS 119925 TaxID=1340428 RepID=A0A6A6VAD6_9PLEO|nr:hypothetical protein M011DRAFT_459398 [Sporormia fimetaria CBS 119925]